MEKTLEKELLEIEYRIEKGIIKDIQVLGKKFRIKDIKRGVLNKIYDVIFKANFYEGVKEDGLHIMRKRLKFVNSADARISSYILLNSFSYIPFLHAIHWRFLNYKYSTETFNAIVETALDDTDVSFFLKNSVHYQRILGARVMMIK